MCVREAADVAGISLDPEGQRLLAGILEELDLEIADNLSAPEAVAVFAKGWEEFRPGYHKMNSAALLSLLLLLVVYLPIEWPEWAQFGLLLPLLVLAGVAWRRMLAFRRDMRLTLTAIGARAASPA